METRCFKLTVFLFFVMLLSSACIPQPERSTKVYTSRQYTEFTEYKEFESGLYDERYIGKNYKMKLFYNGPANEHLARMGVSGKIKITVLAQKDNPAKLYNIQISKDYRDLIFSMKDGAPITVYGTMRANIANFPPYFECDKLVKGHE